MATQWTPEHMRSVFESVKNWGRWGEDDEAGAQGLIQTAGPTNPPGAHSRPPPPSDPVTRAAAAFSPPGEPAHGSQPVYNASVDAPDPKPLGPLEWPGNVDDPHYDGSPG